MAITNHAIATLSQQWRAELLAPKVHSSPSLGLRAGRGSSLAESLFLCGTCLGRLSPTANAELLSALRYEFGGHVEKAAKSGHSSPLL